MLSILGFLVILGPLVIVHEFGHYLFARLFNVKAEAFSIGFGWRIFKKQIGETEWRVSAIPLGGYVKLLGEDRDAPLPPELAARALHKQAPWKRFFIFFGGPLFNFLFAILVFMAILAIGEPQVASVAGRVVQDSPAAKAGLRSGDQIREVNGAPVTKFEEVLVAANESPGKPLALSVLHPGEAQAKRIEVTPTVQEGYTVYGEVKHIGEIEGLLPNPRGLQAGISNPSSAASQAGIGTGDQVVAMNGAKLTSWEDLEAAFERAPSGSEVRLKIERGTDKSTPDAREVVLRKPSGARSPSEAWGLHSSELFIEKTVPDSPAAAAGLQNGDRLIGVGGGSVRSFFDLREAVQKAGERDGKVQLQWERSGKLMSAAITPSAAHGKDPSLRQITQFTVGVMPMISYAEPVMTIERTWNPALLLVRGTERMVTLSWRNFVSIGKMFKGDVSVGTLGGPIMIGKIAGESISRGLIAFLSTMAVLSIGLGVLNILPVPVLDGGHLLLLAVESVRGKPLTLRQMEIVQGVGLSLILLLMVVVIRNDISRVFSVLN